MVLSRRLDRKKKRSLKQAREMVITMTLYGQNQINANHMDEMIIAEMVTSFSDRLSGGRLKQDTMERLHGEFYAVLRSLFDDFKSIKIDDEARMETRLFITGSTVTRRLKWWRLAVRRSVLLPRERCGTIGSYEELS